MSAELRAEIAPAAIDIEVAAPSIDWSAGNPIARGDLNPVAGEKAVNFYDYDGTCRYSYTAAAFAALDALPPNPSHAGLTAQGWNWTLADAKSYVASFGGLDIGQTYITSDGKTRIYIRLTKGRLSPYVGFSTNGSVDIDWGDGSAHSTVTGSDLNNFVNTRHDYAEPGDYVITLDATSGTMDLWGSGSGSRLVWGTVGNNDPYRNAVTKVELGANISYLGLSAFDGLSAMKSISIPLNAHMVSANYMFYNCYSLRHVTLPSDAPATVDGFWFQYCRSMRSLSLPKSVTAFSANGNQLRECCCLRRICLPSSMTFVPSMFFVRCYGLTSVIIPSSVTELRGEQNFAVCYSLAELHFRPTSPPTVNNSNAWNNLPTDCTIYVPTGSLSAYTGATNYPDPNTYTYVEE